MEKEVLDLIIEGHYSKWFFDVFMTNLMLALKNNASLLFFVSTSGLALSKYTSWKWDDKFFGWIVSKLKGRFGLNKEGGTDGKV